MIYRLKYKAFILLLLFLESKEAWQSKIKKNILIVSKIMIIEITITKEQNDIFDDYANILNK